MIDVKTLREFIKILEESSLAEIEISDDENSIRLAKPTADAPVVSFNGSAPVQAQAVPAVVEAPKAQPAEKAVPEAAPSKSGKAIKSPMVGVFYSAPSPDKPAFVSVGQTVRKGETVCIIEAMKIMNEIAAEESGTVTEILVENGDVVEYEQPLFIIE